MNLLKGFNLSFFETVVYDGVIGDQRRGIEWEYLNPFVIYRPVEFSLGSTDKVQMGASLSYRFPKNVTLYGQVMIDEFKINLLRARERNIANKYGFQLGLRGEKNFPFGRLSYLTEFNLVRPFTYSHGNPGQAFSNMSNPLAHPLGSNFIENATRVLYKTKKWDYTLDFVYYLKGKDLNDTVSWGGDINASYLSSPVDANNERIENGFYIGSGNPIHVAKIQGGLGYEIFPKYKTRAFLTLESQWLSNQGRTTNYIGFYLGIRTELWNDRRNY
jgi:hypothetical protein